MSRQLLRKNRFCVAAMLACLGATAHAESTVSAKISTLGLGAEYVYALKPKLSIVGGINGHSYDHNQNTDDVDFEGNLKLSTVFAGVRYLPWEGAFFLGGSLYINNNKVSLKAQPKSNEFKFNGVSYTTNQLGSVKIDADYPTLAPALSLGWQAKLFGSNVTFTPEFGVLFTGAPELDTSVTCKADQATCDKAKSDIDVERKKIQKDLDKITVYPLISLGLGYTF